MELRRKSVAMDVLNWLMIVVLGVIYIVVKKFGSPHISGFFCFDKDISLPYKSSTVNSILNGVLSYLVPLIIIGMLHYFARRRVVQRRITVNNVAIVFIFGLLNQIVTDLLKLAAGRPRPHFADVCNIMYDQGQSCDIPNTTSRPVDLIFIENYSCRGNADLFESESERENRINEARLSFPSGHSSMAFYGMVLSILILKRAQKNYIVTALFQTACLTYCVFVGISRVNDYKHHTDDVIAGATLGSIFALLAYQQFTPAYTTQRNKESQHLMSSVLDGHQGATNVLAMRDQARVEIIDNIDRI